MCDFVKKWISCDICHGKLKKPHHPKLKPGECCGGTLQGTVLGDSDGTVEDYKVLTSGGCVEFKENTFYCRDRNLQLVIVYLTADGAPADVALPAGVSLQLLSDSCDLDPVLNVGLNESIVFQTCQTDCDTAGDFSLQLVNTSFEPLPDEVTATVQIVCGPLKCPGYKSLCKCCSGLYSVECTTIGAEKVPLRLKAFSGKQCTCLVDTAISVEARLGKVQQVLANLTLIRKTCGEISTTQCPGTSTTAAPTTAAPTTLAPVDDEVSVCLLGTNAAGATVTCGAPQVISWPAGENITIPALVFNTESCALDGPWSVAVSVSPTVEASVASGYVQVIASL